MEARCQRCNKKEEKELLWSIITFDGKKELCDGCRERELDKSTGGGMCL